MFSRLQRGDRLGDMQLHGCGYYHGVDVGSQHILKNPKGFFDAVFFRLPVEKLLIEIA